MNKNKPKSNKPEK